MPDCTQKILNKNELWYSWKFLAKTVLYSGVVHYYHVIDQINHRIMNCFFICFFLVYIAFVLVGRIALNTFDYDRVLVLGHPD